MEKYAIINDKADTTIAALADETPTPTPRHRKTTDVFVRALFLHFPLGRGYQREASR